MAIKQIFFFIAAVCLTTGCRHAAQKPTEISVNRHLLIAIHQYDEDSGKFNPDSALIEETVIITHLVQYPTDSDSITVTFLINDVSEYSKITAENIGRRIAIIADGNLVSTPVVTMQLDNGACSFTISRSQAKSLFPHIEQNLRK